MSPPFYKPPYSHTRPVIPTKRVMFGLTCPVCSRAVWSFETTTSSLDGSPLAKPYFYVTCALKCFVTSSRHYDVGSARHEWSAWALSRPEAVSNAVDPRTLTVEQKQHAADEQAVVDRLLNIKLRMQQDANPNKKGGSR